MRTTTKHFAWLVALASMLLPASAAGIPEPRLVIYGSVTNTAGPIRLIPGAVNWTVAGAGSIISVSSTIANVNGQLFYIARIPFETRFAGNLTFSPTTNTLPLPASPTAFIRTATVGGLAATFVSPASTNFLFSKAGRGRIERVDLVVDLPAGPAVDSDGDGMSDGEEGITGTDPRDPHSVFRVFKDLQPAPGGGVILFWSSVAGKRYSILRATDPGGVFTPLSAELLATPPRNQFLDRSATGVGPYFYRILLEP